jgi:hypothetical protein
MSHSMSTMEIPKKKVMIKHWTTCSWGNGTVLAKSTFCDYSVVKWRSFYKKWNRCSIYCSAVQTILK